jgi:hypothetical protein
MRNGLSIEMKLVFCMFFCPFSFLPSIRLHPTQKDYLRLLTHFRPQVCSSTRFTGRGGTVYYLTNMRSNLDSSPPYLTTFTGHPTTTPTLLLVQLTGTNPAICFKLLSLKMAHWVYTPRGLLFPSSLCSRFTCRLLTISFNYAFCCAVLLYLNGLKKEKL